MAGPIVLLDALTRVAAIALASPGVAAVVGTKVYNHVPQGTAYPYVGVRFQSVEGAPPKEGPCNYALTVRFDLFSDQPSDAQVLALTDALVLAFDAQEFIGGAYNFTLDVSQFVSASYALSDDGVVHLASVIFTMFATPTN